MASSKETIARATTQSEDEHRRLHGFVDQIGGLTEMILVRLARPSKQPTHRQVRPSKMFVDWSPRIPDDPSAAG
jgi:hypothetical protein